MSQKLRTLGIFIFDDVEVLDFAGPFEVFSVTSELNNPPPFDVKLIGEATGTVTARNGLRVVPDQSIAETKELDIVLIPGGFGTRRSMNNPVVIEWISRMSRSAELTLSVCTGSLLLAKAGLLKGKPATTHHELFDMLSELDRTIDVRTEERIVDTGAIVTSGGISAGIDMSLHIVSRLCGEKVAAKTAGYMEYRWKPEELAIVRSR